MPNYETRNANLGEFPRSGMPLIGQSMTVAGTVALSTSWESVALAIPRARVADQSQVQAQQIHEQKRCLSMQKILLQRQKRLFHIQKRPSHIWPTQTKPPKTQPTQTKERSTQKKFNTWREERLIFI